MRRFHITRDDLLVEPRQQGHTEALEQVREAYIEPGGEISVILAGQPA